MKRAGQAVQFDRYGTVEELHFVAQEMPHPSRDELVVEVVAAGLNHLDSYIRGGDFATEVPLTFPTGQGSCFAGIVRARGKDVRSTAVGADVLGHAVGNGAHATYVVVPASAVVLKPPTVEWEVAGGLYLAGTTALATIRGLRVGPDDVMVITAAAGGVGHLQVQLALAAGATVIGTGSAHNHDYIRSLGAVPVTYGDGLIDRIREAAHDRPITALIDNHGSSGDLAEQLGVVGSRFVSTEDRRDIELRFYTADGTDSEGTELLSQLVRMIEQHSLRMLVSGFYPFQYLQQATADLDARHSRGKVIVGMKTAVTGSGVSTHYLGQKARAFHESVA